MNAKGLLTMMALLLFSLVSCSSEESATAESGDTISGDAGKTLIVYFSWGGNTRTVANHVHNLIGGDIVEVETVVPYAPIRQYVAVWPCMATGLRIPGKRLKNGSNK